MYCVYPCTPDIFFPGWYHRNRRHPRPCCGGRRLHILSWVYTWQLDRNKSWRPGLRSVQARWERDFAVEMAGNVLFIKMYILVTEGSTSTDRERLAINNYFERESA